MALDFCSFVLSVGGFECLGRVDVVAGSPVDMNRREVTQRDATVLNFVPKLLPLHLS